MLVNSMSTYLLYHCLHKVQTSRLTGGLFEGKFIISFFCAGGQEVGEVGVVVCRGLGYLFVVEQLGCKTFCFRKNGLGGRYGHICEEEN